MFLPADSNVKSGKERSFADDLNVQRGIVSSRVALLLRSAEIKPQLSDLLNTVGGGQPKEQREGAREGAQALISCVGEWCRDEYRGS